MVFILQCYGAYSGGYGAYILCVLFILIIQYKPNHLHSSAVPLY